MNALSPIVANKFFELCDNAHTVWRTHRALFDDNPKKKQLEISPAGKALIQLSVTSQEYMLHQICKLHDKAIINGNATLGLDYVLRFGGWDPTTRARLQALRVELDAFASQLRGARNKILSHNDLETHLDGVTLGAFDAGKDVVYFEKLQEFVNIVYETTFGNPAPFNKDADTNVAALLDCLKL